MSDRDLESVKRWADSVGRAIAKILFDEWDGDPPPEIYFVPDMESGRADGEDFDVIAVVNDRWVNLYDADPEEDGALEIATHPKLETLLRVAAMARASREARGA